MVRERSQPPGCIAFRWLDLNDIGPQVGEDFATVWARDSLGEFDYLYLGQQPGCLSHNSPLLQPSRLASRGVFYLAGVACQLAPWRNVYAGGMGN